MSNVIGHTETQLSSPRRKPGGSTSAPRWRGALIATAVLALSACVNAPTKPPVAPAPAVLSLDDYMQQAAQAMAEGSLDKAREGYRSAAKAYPASKQPWSKLAEDFYAAGDYGNAILAAQEVVLRDPNDTGAASVLAVSGLRVSSASLQRLRSQSRIAGDTRSEAETMTQVLRDVLGEDVLVPRPSSNGGAGKRRAAAKASATSKPIVGATTTATTTASTSGSPAAAAGNPFDKLK